MSVDTKTVQGRRELHFKSFDEVLADAERLVTSPNTNALGNWSLNQLLMHLALTIHLSIDGINVRAPWYIRLVGFFIRGRILRRGMPAGFKLPREREIGAFPSAASTQEALETLRKAIARLKTEKMTARHPAFGKLSHEQWVQLHLRHAELHLSFIIPGEGTANAGINSDETLTYQSRP
jgi:hypothetical protein